MSPNDFFKHFKDQDFVQATTAFNNLSLDDQQDILKQLYYGARDAESPIAVSVLYRKLYDGKTFDDFFNAWMPPQEHLKPFKVGEKNYYHFFDAPTRVINASNLEDPKEIISIGYHWCTEQEFTAALEKEQKGARNKIRSDNIATVAEKISAKIYKVKSDVHLGN